MEPGIPAHQDLLIQIAIAAIGVPHEIGHAVLVVERHADRISLHIVEVFPFSDDRRQGIADLLSFRIKDVRAAQRVFDHMKSVHKKPSLPHHITLYTFLRNIPDKPTLRVFPAVSVFGHNVLG